jgi:hypothetical protein
MVGKLTNNAATGIRQFPYRTQVVLGVAVACTAGSLPQREELTYQIAVAIPFLTSFGARPDELLDGIAVVRWRCSSFANVDAPAQPVISKLRVLARTTKKSRFWDSISFNWAKPNSLPPLPVTI